MKKNILLLLMSLVFFMTADVQAEDSKFYTKIFGGANFLQSITTQGNKSTYHTGYIIDGSIGYYWCYGLRLEAEYAYRRNAIREIHFITQGSSNHGNFQASSYMANVLWDLPLTSCGCTFWNIQSFIGAGIGYDCQRMHSSNSRIIFNQKWKHFSWQLMAGLSYPIFCDTEISLEYKFHQGGCHFYNHSVGVGLLYKFNL